ncbi:hypothetical protein BD560DRAFT_419734 [Blakeslea trispora]|nr:hypothetical protein BD560DRAFT_419734 [Blakeslea trispora]
MVSLLLSIAFGVSVLALVISNDALKSYKERKNQGSYYISRIHLKSIMSFFLLRPIAGKRKEFQFTKDVLIRCLVPLSVEILLRLQFLNHLEEDNSIDKTTMMPLFSFNNYAENINYLHKRITFYSKKGWHFILVQGMGHRKQVSWGPIHCLSTALFMKIKIVRTTLSCMPIPKLLALHLKP